MPYITTNHRFLIDEKHPADVFDEMENFFSLYTVAIDDLQQVSVQLSVPTNFDVKANKSIAEGYRQFTKSLKYTIPDINILPIKTYSESTNEDESEDGNTITLLIQRLDGYDIDEEKPSLYQSVLGRLMPKFASDKTEDGFYPQQKPNQTLPEPLPPTRPTVQPTIPQAVVPVAVIPQPSIQPPIPPVIAAPVPQYQPQPQTHQPPQPIPQPIAQPVQQAATPNLQRLPNIIKSAKAYQDILTQAIVNEAKKQGSLLNNQTITQITLKSSDTLTTAMIEQLFNSFNHAHDKTQSPHDAIDLVSYGYEVLKPQLAKMGVTLADDAGFGLKTNSKATPTDIARLQSGAVFSNEINLKVKLETAQAQHQSLSQHQNQNSQNDLTSPTINHPNMNKNAQNIALMLKISDQLGERQQKVSRFPLIFGTREAKVTDAIRLFASQNQSQLQGNIYFSMIELDGNVLLDSIDPNVKIMRHGQVLASQTLLMPNDTLSVDCHGLVGTVTLSLV